MRFFSTAVFFATHFFVGAEAIDQKALELPSSLSTSSRLGKQLLASAQRVDTPEQRNLEQDAELDLSWILNYSIKFQGCHHITQWNDEADGGEDVRIATRRLVRFRLCPSDSCDSSSSGGCSSSYGEYIVDMDVFLELYMQDKMELQEYTCEYYEMNKCKCNDDDQNQRDDAWEEEDCLNECFYNYGLDYCVEEEMDDQAGEPFELEEYMECREFRADRRRLTRQLDQEVEYFIGPYCSEQGGKIYLGMFTDESCSIFADDYAGTTTYKNFMGESLPYSSESIVGMECITCEPLQEVEDENDNNNNNNNNQNDDGEVEIKETCEQLWQTAGKCEKKLDYVVDEPNKNACNYMDGIKVIRKDGVVQVKRGSSAAAAFIGVFSVSSVLLGGYVYYLSTKMGKGKIDIN